MRLPTILPALFAAAANLASASDTALTAAIYIQPLNAPSTTPSLLAELAIPDQLEEPATAADVISYFAPDLPEDESDESSTQAKTKNLVRIGIYDPFAKRWVSSTTVTSAENFAKGYAPHFVLTLGAGEEGGYLGVACRGVAIDAGVTRDFGPQALVVRTAPGAQPALGKPVVLSPEGRKVGEEGEKSFLQKYVTAFILRESVCLEYVANDCAFVWQVLVGVGDWSGLVGWRGWGSEVIDLGYVWVGVLTFWVLQFFETVENVFDVICSGRTSLDCPVTVTPSLYPDGVFTDPWASCSRFVSRPVQVPIPCLPRFPRYQQPSFSWHCTSVQRALLGWQLLAQPALTPVSWSPVVTGPMKLVQLNTLPHKY